VVVVVLDPTSLSAPLSSPRRGARRSSAAAMDRVQLVLLGLPILLFCSDVVTLFAPLPPAGPEPDKAPHAFQPGDPSAADASAHVVCISTAPD